jgi:hypothetical protein
VNPIGVPTFEEGFFVPELGFDEPFGGISPCIDNTIAIIEEKENGRRPLQLNRWYLEESSDANEDTLKLVEDLIKE